ncbi:HAD family hydrolase [Nocardia fluminea]|uniref:HAD family hydrolase n=1 Tax=Nocardia fluminea TaxID=134984 RepID=UPI0034188559
MSRTAILVGFDGVLTTTVSAALRAFGRQIDVYPDLPLELIAKDPVMSRAFALLESGRLGDREFESLVARRLADHGATVEPTGLLERIRAGIEPDYDTIDLIAGVRAAGHPVAVVSNSLGRDWYQSVDIASLVDVAVVSSEVGFRKPSPEIYELACRRLNVEPDRALVIDGLRHNIEGARRCGIEGIVHANATRTAEELAIGFGVFTVLPPSSGPPPTERRRGTSQWLR